MKHGTLRCSIVASDWQRRVTHVLCSKDACPCLRYLNSPDTNQCYTFGAMSMAPYIASQPYLIDLIKGFNVRVFMVRLAVAS